MTHSEMIKIRIIEKEAAREKERQQAFVDRVFGPAAKEGPTKQ